MECKDNNLKSQNSGFYTKKKCTFAIVKQQWSFLSRFTLCKVRKVGTTQGAILPNRKVAENGKQPVPQKITALSSLKSKGENVR